MKKAITILFLACSLMSLNTVTSSQLRIIAEKIDIKIKNDTNDEVKVINAGSGGSYSLTKNATTIIKMEEGDKLYYYEKAKKGTLLLTATAAMHGKVQLLSKI